MFIAALFIIAKTWRQPKCPPTEGWIKKIWYIHTVEVRSRFKGLDVIDRVFDELWTEVHDIVQETGMKTIPMEKKSKKAKWGGLTNSCEKKRGEKQRRKGKI